MTFIPSVFGYGSFSGFRHAVFSVLLAESCLHVKQRSPIRPRPESTGGGSHLSQRLCRAARAEIWSRLAAKETLPPPPRRQLETDEVPPMYLGLRVIMGRLLPNAAG